MEMEDHQHQQQQYGGMTDLRQLVSNNGARSTHFATSIAAQPTAELFPGHPNLAAAQHQHYEMMMFGRHVADLMPRCLHEFGDVNNNASSIGVGTATTPTTTTSASTPPLSGGPGCLVGDASTGRWPRQETLTLLEIRSRLDPKFKEANQKGPLWDEVSRIMSEEHGYQRSGKKCREKFENLYKYYKKTKEGKAGRQDGKHYRFFRQLEALYGENNSNAASAAQETNFGGSTTLHYHTNTHAFNSHINQEMLLLGSQNSLSLTNSTEFETTSSDDDDHNSTGGVKEKNDESTEKIRRKRGGAKSWKVKIKDFIDLQMRKLVQKQEEWLDKLMKTLEQKEKERVLREEEWRRQEAARLEREHKFWAKERAWIEARDAALMEALHKLTGTATDQVKSHHHDGIIMQNEEHNNEDGENWQECEISRLVQLRAEIVETRFRQGGGSCSEEGLWEEIATKMACFGYERSSTKLKEKWETISKGINNKKKRKENNPNSSVVRSSSSCFYIENNSNNNDHYSSSSSLYNNHGYCDINNDQRRQQQSSPSNSNANASVQQAENCFPFLMGCEGGTLWDNYSLKVNKPNQNHQ